MATYFAVDVIGLSGGTGAVTGEALVAAVPDPFVGLGFIAYRRTSSAGWRA